MVASDNTPPATKTEAAKIRPRENVGNHAINRERKLRPRPVPAIKEMRNNPPEGNTNNAEACCNH